MGACRPGEVGAGAAFLARVLQYMETPQYLRKALVAMHQDLRMAGSLPPLDAPHHLRASEWGPFREGVIKSSDPTWGSVIDIGLEQVSPLHYGILSHISMPCAGRLVLLQNLEVPRVAQNSLGLAGHPASQSSAACKSPADDK